MNEKTADAPNIASFLPDMATRQPETHAVVLPRGRDRRGRPIYSHYTYKDLDEQSDRLARGLGRVGIERGTRAVLMVTPSLEFFALTFALFKAGVVPVMVDPGMGIKNLGQCLREAKPEAFIGVAKAHLARSILGWARDSIRTRVTVGFRWPGSGVSLEQVRRLGGEAKPFEMVKPEADETAAILFTSGSTGVPKGAVYTHGIFVNQVRLIRDLYGIEPGEVDLPTFPLFALFAPALGMTAIIPEMDPTRPARVDPQKLVDAISDFKVTNMFGSPAVINRLGRHGEASGVKLPTLRRVISAGAPASPKSLARFQKMLSPGVEVFTPYGATEALPVASIGSEEILSDTREATARGEGVCVGHPFPDIDVRVIRIVDAAIEYWDESLTLPHGEIGEIAVRGPVVTREYYNRPESTRLAKILDTTSGDIYHRMGDLGYFDDEGRLWFCGRKTQRVSVENETLYTIPCEGVFNAHPSVFRSALVGVSQSGKPEPVLCVELEARESAQRKRQIERELLELGATHEHTRAIRHVFFHNAFPVDIRHNAKIFREKLAVWAERRLS